MMVLKSSPNSLTSAIVHLISHVDNAIEREPDGFCDLWYVTLSLLGSVLILLLSLLLSGRSFVDV